MVIGGGLDYTPTIQKGFRERILCRDCETHLNRNIENPYEKEYLDILWNKGKVVNQFQDGELRYFEDLNYKVIKLMHLSLASN